MIPRSICQWNLALHVIKRLMSTMSLISGTRKRRRLTHKSLVSARFVDDSEEEDAMQFQSRLICAAFANIFDEKRPVVGTIGATGFEGDLFPVAKETSCQPGESEFRGHEHTVQLLEKRDDTAPLSTVFEIDGTKTESCQQRKFLGLSAVAEVQRNSSSLGKVQRRNLSSMTKVFSLIFAAAQHLDSPCTDCWNRAVRFGRPDLLKVFTNSDSPLVEAVESAGGEGLRTSFRNGYDLTTRRGRECLCQFCSTKRLRHVWFSSLCRVSGASSQRVSRIQDELQPWFRDCKHLAVTFILHRIR